jgi:mannose-6-phosphate isomerase-like protein (cupin superfamily)
MQPLIKKTDPNSEFLTPERCWILESWNEERDPAVSIARARVAAGTATRLHRLRAVDERYLIVEGAGTVRVGDLPPSIVKPGDVVVIPAGVSQQISNEGPGDLVFYCICTPRFTPDCYQALE